MNCKATREQLSAYMEGEVSEVERRRLAAHLDGCSQCAAEFESLKKTVTLLRWIPQVEPDPGFTARVMARMRSEAARPTLGLWLRTTLDRWSALWPAYRLDVSLPVAASIAVLSMAIGVFATLKAVDVPVELAGDGDRVNIPAELAAGLSGIDAAPATAPSPPSRLTSEVQRGLAVEGTGRGGSQVAVRFRGDDRLGDRPEGPASVGQVEYVLPQLRPMPAQQSVRQLPAGVHVENGYVVF